jgi:3-hydroxybutyrate dehydrogenase
MSMAMDASRPLAGRVAAVSGSTSGIGLAVAEALARAGADVALNGFGDPSPAVSAVKAHGVRARHFDADMSDGPAARGWVHSIQADFGRLDILVNNAGIQHVAPVEDFPPERWDAIIAINLSSNFHTIRAAVPMMRERNWGRIINIASAHGLVASPFKSAYVAAKHGVLGLTKSVALELAETCVTVNAICPGFVKTPLVEGQIADQAKAHGMTEDRVVREVILASQPSKRFIEASHVGETAVYLCTDAASGMTGTAVSLDGGWTAR